MWSVDFVLNRFASRRLAWIVLLAASLAGGACSTTEPIDAAASHRSASAADVEASPLQPGDAIRVSFSREPDQNGTYQVDATGLVSLPFIGSHVVTSTPPDSLRRELLSAYDGQLRNQTVSVELLRRVRVLGAVKQPGLYQVDAAMTLADVVAQAGGTTEDGRHKRRSHRTRRPSRSRQRRGRRRRFPYLASGDQVLVPE